MLPVHLVQAIVSELRAADVLYDGGQGLETEEDVFLVVWTGEELETGWGELGDVDTHVGKADVLHYPTEEMVGGEKRERKKVVTCVAGGL